MDVEHVESNRCFQGQVEGERCYLYYDLVNDRKMNIQSTFVPRALRGRGLGRDLVDAAIDYANDQGWDVEADCWYARKVLNERREE